MAKPDYGKALDELEALHRAGKISDARYEMHKRNLIAGAYEDNDPIQRIGRRVQRLGLHVFLGVIALLVLLIIVAVIVNLVR